MPPGATLIVTRHADRAGENLTSTGRARALALVQALESVPLGAIHAPVITRNLDTAAPLSAARGLPVKRIPANFPTARLVRSASRAPALWIGNKGNIRTIREDLSLPAPIPLDYGDLAIIRSDAMG